MAKNLLIVIQHIRDLYHMERWNRELLDKYCRQYNVVVLGFLPSVDEGVKNEAVDDRSGCLPTCPSAHQLLVTIHS